jgi:hypothetical protein
MLGRQILEWHLQDFRSVLRSRSEIEGWWSPSAVSRPDLDMYLDKIDDELNERTKRKKDPLFE